MCVLNKSIFEKNLLKIDKIVNKLFPKLVYYCILLRYILVNSYIYIYIERERENYLPYSVNLGEYFVQWANDSLIRRCS